MSTIVHQIIVEMSTSGKLEAIAALEAELQPALAESTIRIDVDEEDHEPTPLRGGAKRKAA